MPHVTTSDGVRLHGLDWGHGPPIVLVHGWPLDADMWEYQATALVQAGFRVVMPDRRGFGRSDHPWHGYDYDTLADDLAAVMKAADVRDATLVGFSMGGGEVVRYLSRHGSQRVRSVALISSVTPFLVETPENPEGVDRSTFDQMTEQIEADRPKFLASFARHFYGVGVLSRPVSSELLEWHRGMALRGSSRATLACIKAFSATDFRSELAGIEPPVLVVHGDADTIVPYAASGKRTAAAIPNSRERVYAGAPHGLFVTHRGELNKDLAVLARG